MIIMAEQCKFPLCKRFAEKNGYCIGHRIYASQSTESLKEKNDSAAVKKTDKPVSFSKIKTAIKKVSLKMADIKKQLKKLYPQFLKKHPFCEINSPVCTKVATCINHKKGRGKNEILNEETWEASCTACNGYIEENDSWARENGHKVSRHSK